MKVLTAEQMQAVDRRTIETIGIPGVVLMENAGRGVAEEIMRRLPDLASQRVLVLAGKGNNGGDGYVVARYLQSKGWQVQTVVLAGRSAIKGDAAVNLKALENCGGVVSFVETTEAFEQQLSSCGRFGLVVDALFGTGLSKDVSGIYKDAITWINRQKDPVLSVDVPSGIDASTGGILGVAVAAALTVTFAYPKIGLVSYPGAGHSGELVVVDIGIPSVVAEDVPSDCRLISKAEALALLPLRSADGHKGTFGHLLVLAGSSGKCGAAVMAAESALRGGAGLVTLACPQGVQQGVAARLTEVMTVPLEDADGEVSLQAYEALLALTDEKEAMAVGPGLGCGDEVFNLVRSLLKETTLPVVVDADGLNALCGHLHLLGGQTGRQVVLTPHPGEMARLTGLSASAIQADRFNVAREFARLHGVTLVLKGAHTLIASADGRVNINTTGHAGLASGGMGDVLTGLVGSLLGQGLTAFDAATLAVYLHGLAADRLLPRFGDAGLLATDVMYELPAARRALSKET